MLRIPLFLALFFLAACGKEENHIDDMRGAWDFRSLARGRNGDIDLQNPSMATVSSSLVNLSGSGTSGVMMSDDTAEYIASPSRFPYRATGMISGCSGTLIGPRQVLTAGHCVYKHATSSWYQNLDFLPASQNNAFSWDKVFVARRFIEQHDSRYDFAVVVLDDAIGDQLGWLKVASIDVRGQMVHVLGFPRDKPDHTLWMSACLAEAASSDYYIYHRCITASGSSGSAILRQGSGEPVLVGVHTNGQNSDADAKFGPRMSPKALQMLATWVE